MVEAEVKVDTEVETGKKRKYRMDKPYNRGYPGYLQPFYYDAGDDEDNPQTDWTFIWFWILVVMSLYIIICIIVAYATSDVLEEGYESENEKKEREEKEKAE